jgi:DNA-binding NtrC family response regulator
LGDEWQLAPDVLPVLERYSWPGNVRQLINAVDRAKTLAETNVIELRNLPAEIVGRIVRPSLPSPGSDVDLETLNRLHVAEVYRRHNGNKARTARALGIGRRSLYRLLEKYHIDQPNGSQAEAMA